MSNRRIVYLCPTLLSLMNSIVAQMTVNKQAPADIVFEDTSDFSEISQRLMRHSVFENCYQFDYLKEIPHYRAMSRDAQREIVRKPSKVFNVPAFQYPYTDLCANIDSFAPKFFYYSLIEQGMSPKIHFVSEGTGTYALDFANTARDKMDHAYYGEKAFLKNVQNIYMYQPELYTGGANFVTPTQLPLYSTLSPDIHKVIEDVFGKAQTVKEKLIFFEGTFWGDGYLVDEMGLFLAITDYIGRENVVVKRHPRNAVDRFTPLGFHVMPQQNIPWEVMIKDIDLTQKALVSVASFTCFSSMEMYGKLSRSILLEDLMRGRVSFLADAGYRRFFQRAEKFFNSEEIVSWRPASVRELQLTLDAIGDKIGGWNR